MAPCSFCSTVLSDKSWRLDGDGLLGSGRREDTPKIDDVAGAEARKGCQVSGCQLDKLLPRIRESRTLGHESVNGLQLRVSMSVLLQGSIWQVDAKASCCYKKVTTTSACVNAILYACINHHALSRTTTTAILNIVF